MENRSKEIPLIFKRSDRNRAPRTYSAFLTDDEVSMILNACLASGPKTDEELSWVLKYCENIMVEHILLELVFEGKIILKRGNEEKMAWRSSGKGTESHDA